VVSSLTASNVCPVEVHTVSVTIQENENLSAESINKREIERAHLQTLADINEKFHMH
jgi:hypothetical protein